MGNRGTAETGTSAAAAPASTTDSPDMAAGQPGKKSTTATSNSRQISLVPAHNRCVTLWREVRASGRNQCRRAGALSSGEPARHVLSWAHVRDLHRSTPFSRTAVRGHAAPMASRSCEITIRDIPSRAAACPVCPAVPDGSPDPAPPAARRGPAAAAVMPAVRPGPPGASGRR